MGFFHSRSVLPPIFGIKVFRLASIFYSGPFLLARVNLIDSLIFVSDRRLSKVHLPLGRL